MPARHLIAVVDDDASVLESLPPLLRSFGFEVSAYSSAESFLESGLTDYLQCLILDVAMPGMGGQELQEELIQRRVGVPIVFITALSDHQLCERLLRRGAVACLQKPFSQDRLLEAIQTAIQAKESGALVFVVDDDISVRESTEALLQTAGYAVESFGSAQEFLRRQETDLPACLVLDVELPGLNGLELQQQFIASGIQLPIVFITGHGDIPMSVQAMKGGAVEFLTKPYSDHALLTAVEQALDQCRAVRREQRELDTLRNHYQSLTPREKEVLGFVISGLLNKQIAAELGTSEITIKTHRGNVMRKMAAASLADLVRMASALKIPLHTRD